MKSVKQQKPSPKFQLAMALDSARLRGIKPADRKVVITRLASLLMEAAGIAATEANTDDHV